MAILVFDSDEVRKSAIMIACNRSGMGMSDIALIHVYYRPLGDEIPPGMTFTGLAAALQMVNTSPSTNEQMLIVVYGVTPYVRNRLASDRYYRLLTRLFPLSVVFLDFQITGDPMSFKAAIEGLVDEIRKAELQRSFRNMTAETHPREGYGVSVSTPLKGCTHKKALVFEDDEGIRSILENELMKVGAQCTVLANLDYCGEGEWLRSKFGGLEIALCYAKEGRMVIVYEFASRIDFGAIARTTRYKQLQQRYGARVVFRASDLECPNWHAGLINEAIRLAQASRFEALMYSPPKQSESVRSDLPTGER